MNTDPLLRTPLAVEEYITQNFPALTVQIDGEREIVNISLPHTLEMPHGGQVTISTLVIRDTLSDVIKDISRFTLSLEDATRALSTCTALTGWDEARATLNERQRLFERQRPTNTCSWWSTAAQHVTRALAAVWRDIAHISTIGGPYPPNVQTILVALNAIAAAGACIGKVFFAPALGLSLFTRAANIVVLAGRCCNPDFATMTKFAGVELVLYLEAFAFLLLPGPWGIISSGVLASFPEVVTWVVKFLPNIHSQGIPPFQAEARDPTDLNVARDVFNVPEGQEPNQASVDQIYDDNYNFCCGQLRLARERGQSLIITLAERQITFLKRAYMALMGHPRFTDVD